MSPAVIFLESVELSVLLPLSILEFETMARKTRRHAEAFLKPAARSLDPPRLRSDFHIFPVKPIHVVVSHTGGRTHSTKFSRT